MLFVKNIVSGLPVSRNLSHGRKTTSESFVGFIESTANRKASERENTRRIGAECY